MYADFLGSISDVGAVVGEALAVRRLPSGFADSIRWTSRPAITGLDARRPEVTVKPPRY